MLQVVQDAPNQIIYKNLSLIKTGFYPLDEIVTAQLNLNMSWSMTW